MAAAHRQSPPLASKLGATVLLLVTLPGLAVAHVNALVTLVLFSYLMVAGVVLRKASDLRASRPLLAAASVVGLVLATGHFRSGVLLAPVTAGIITDYLESERLPDATLPFLPERFVRPDGNGRTWK